MSRATDDRLAILARKVAQLEDENASQRAAYRTLWGHATTLAALVQDVDSAEPDDADADLQDLLIGKGLDARWIGAREDVDAILATPERKP